MGRTEDLFHAVQSGDVETALSIIQKSGLLEQRSSGISAIIAKTRLNINRADASTGYTLLHFACQNDYVDLIDILIDAGADVCACDCSGNQPLHLAAWGGFVDVLTALIRRGCRVNDAAFDGNTPLHLAAQHGRVAVVSELLHSGADPLAINCVGMTAIDLAARFGRVAVLNVFIGHSSALTGLPDPPSSNHTPLHLAARGGHIECVKALLDWGIDINICTSSGTCLHDACVAGKYAVVEELLNRGADALARNGNNMTPSELLEHLQVNSQALLGIRDMLTLHIEALSRSHVAVDLAQSNSITVENSQSACEDEFTTSSHRRTSSTVSQASASSIERRYASSVKRPSITSLNRSGLDIVPNSVESLLNDFKLGQYADAFEIAGYDSVSHLVHWTSAREVAIDVGVSLAGHKKRLSLALDKLRMIVPMPLVDISARKSYNCKNELLNNLLLECYKTQCLPNDYASLSSLCDFELSQLGIEKIGHRRRLLYALTNKLSCDVVVEDTSLESFDENQENVAERSKSPSRNINHIISRLHPSSVDICSSSALTSKPRLTSALPRPFNSSFSKLGNGDLRHSCGTNSAGINGWRHCGRSLSLDNLLRCSGRGKVLDSATVTAPTSRNEANETILNMEDIFYSITEALTDLNSFYLDS